MFKRDKYLKELINLENNHLIKVITGARRSGKSFLLNEIFYSYLIKEKLMDKSHIIKFPFGNIFILIGCDYEAYQLFGNAVDDHPSFL